VLILIYEASLSFVNDQGELKQQMTTMIKLLVTSSPNIVIGTSVAFRMYLQSMWQQQ
jgi:hypothetical protein